jgi:hypothetical protein
MVDHRRVNLVNTARSYVDGAVKRAPELLESLKSNPRIEPVIAFVNRRSQIAAGSKNKRLPLLERAYIYFIAYIAVAVNLAFWLISFTWNWLQAHGDSRVSQKMASWKLRGQEIFEEAMESNFQWVQPRMTSLDSKYFRGFFSKFFVDLQDARVEAKKESESPLPSGEGRQERAFNNKLQEDDRLPSSSGASSERQPKEAAREPGMRRGSSGGKKE